MIEATVQIFGMAWCALCLGCIIFSFSTYIKESLKK
jgi:hypothetical protein